MSKKGFKVLIIDDDTALLKVLAAALEKVGYAVFTCASADEALSKARHTDFNAIIVDCMLPKMSGVDLVQKMKVFSPNSAFILISGIFKDRSFINETLESTKAQHFLVKPFPLDELLRIIDSYAKLSPAFKPESWLDFWEKSDIEIFQKRLGSLKSINGQELPYLVSLILNYEMKGSLKIKIPEVTAEIFFDRGLITQLNSSDKTSYFGALLIQSGLISNEEVEEHLKSQRTDPLGDSLVKAQLLSPHAIEQTLKQQTILRLGRMVSSLPTLVEWQPSPPPKLNPLGLEKEVKGVSLADLSEHFYLWCQSKIKTPWLRSQYVTWLDECPVAAAKPCPKMPEPLKEFLKKCDSYSSVNDMLQNTSNADQLIGWIHALLLSQTIKWGQRKTKHSDFVRLRAKLEALEKNFQTTDHFSVLGVSQSAKAKEIKRAYLDLSKNLHPDHLPADAPEDLRSLNTRVFTYVTKAHETLEDISSRETYLKHLKFNALKEQEAGQQSLYQALDFMDRKSYKQALELFQQIKSSSWQAQYIDLYCIWADIKRRNHLTADEARVFEQKLNELVPEDRHSYLFFFVKGLLAVARNLPEEAKSCFQNSIVLNPQFKHASFELQTLGGKGSLLNQFFNSASSKNQKKKPA